MINKESFKALPFTFQYSNRIICEWICDDEEGFHFALSGDGEKKWIRVGFANPLAIEKWTKEISSEHLQYYRRSLV